MDKKRYTLILLFGMIFGAVLAAISIVEESSVSNYQWAAKIEDTNIPMKKYLVFSLGFIMLSFLFSSADKFPSRIWNLI